MKARLGLDYAGGDPANNVPHKLNVSIVLIRIRQYIPRG